MELAQRPLKILILTTTRIFNPRAGGDLRVVHLARELSELGHYVDVLSLVGRRAPERRQRMSLTLRMHQRHCAWLDLAQLADRLRIIPITELPTWFGRLRGMVRTLTEQEGYDIVQYENLWHSRAAEGAHGRARVVYSSQNIESVWWAQRLARYPLRQVFRARLDEHEIRAIRQADGVTACSQHDIDWILARCNLGLEQVGLVPNGFDARRFVPLRSEERTALRRRMGIENGAKVALFVGSDNPHNRGAVDLILRLILPAVNQSHVQFWIVGRVGNGFSKARVDERVRFLGPVDDILRTMQVADVGLNPVISGSGTNVKLAEYCAAGLPVVTTEFGLRGYEELRPWLDVCEIENFGKAIDNACWPGRVPRPVIEEYSWRHSARKLADFHARLMQASEWGLRRGISAK